MNFSASIGQWRIEEIITKCYLWVSVGKSIGNLGVTEAGTHLSLFSQSRSKGSIVKAFCNSLHVRENP